MKHTISVPVLSKNAVNRAISNLFKNAPEFQQSKILGQNNNMNFDINKLKKDKLHEMAWWEILNVPNMGAYFDYNWAAGAMAFIALNGGPARLEGSRSGDFTKGTSIESLTSQIEKTGCNKIFETKVGTGGEFHFASKNAYIEFRTSGTDHKTCSADFTANDAKIFEKLKGILDKSISSEKVAGKVSVLVTTEYGPEFNPIGLGGHNLERDNYTKEVLDCYDKIVTDLKRSDPSGRLSIFNGPPGTGKTYLIKALINEKLNANCILVPSQYVRELTSPAIIPALLALKSNNNMKESPIVIIIEDADECLVSRESGDMSTISAVLNLCDGIMGSLLDIRIIATTNADKMSLDKALTRPGRLSANVEVQNLPYDRACEILKRIAPKAVLEEVREYSLAEIYNFAKSGEAKATGMKKEKKRAMGFGAN